MKTASKLYIICLIYVLAFCTLGCAKNDDAATTAQAEDSSITVKTFGGSLNDSAQSIIKTSDGGYAILGHTQSNDGDITNKANTSFDYLLLKFNSNNVLEWQKVYGGSANDRGIDLIQTKDGGYALLGLSQSADLEVSQNAGATDFWLVKLDRSGTILWEQTFGFPGVDIGNALLQTQDNGYILTGVLDVSASGGQGNSAISSKRHAGGDYWAIKLDANGTKEWSQFYGGSFTDTPNAIIQTQDNGYLIIGSSDSDDIDITNPKGSYDIWLVKISNSGQLLWEKSIGGSQIDEAWSIVATNDGNYIIAGGTRSNDQDINGNQGAADALLIKISPNGSIIWQNTYGGSNFDAARSITKTSDGGFIVAGNSRSSNGDVSNNKGQNDAWILKLNANGALEWEKTIGGSNTDLLFSAISLNDMSIIAIGETNSNDKDITTNKGFTDILRIEIP
jgi:hypothetical protein